MDVEVLKYLPMIIVGGMCLAAQLAAVLWYVFGLRGYHAYLDRVRKGGPPALVGDRSPPGWFGWLRSQLFESPRTGRLLLPPRAAALSELDWHLQTPVALGLLTRLGYVAPLIGLLLTAVGFIRFNPNDGLDLGGMLSSTLPLMLGVAVGAALALVNQSLLLVAQGYADGVRQAIRDWFDDTAAESARVEPPPPNPAEVPAEQMIQTAHRADDAVARLNHAAGMAGTAAGSMGSAADRSGQAADRLAAAAAATERIAAALTDQLAEVGRQTARWTEQVGELDRSIGRTASAVDRLTDQSVRAADALESGSAAVRQWAETGTDAARALGGAAEKVSDSNRALADGVEGFRAAAAAHGRATEEWATAVRRDLIPAQTVFAEVIRGFATSADTLNSGVDGLNGAVRAIATQVDGLTLTAGNAVGRFDTTVSSLTQAVEQNLVPLARTLAPIQVTMDHLGRVGEPLARAAEAVADVARQHLVTTGDLVPAYRHLTDVLTGAVAAVDQLRAFCATVGPSVQAIDRTAGALDGATEVLSRLAGSGLTPLQERLGQMEAAAVNLAELVRSLQPLSGTGALAAELQRVGRGFERLDAIVSQQEEIVRLLTAARPRGGWFHWR